LTIACGLAVALAWAVGRLVPATAPWGFIIAMAVGLVPIAQRAIAAARFRMPFTIETLMTIAAVGAVAINAAEEAAAVVFLFLVGELLEGVAAGRARASIAGLTKLIPKTALLEQSGKVTEVAANSLAVGVVILVRPGDRIPADGVIVDGESGIDEAPVTGESAPKRKRAGDRVFAGTINQDNALRVRVTASAADNTIARIIKLVEEAQEAKAPTERFIDRFSSYYTPAVLALGAIVATLPPLLVGGVWGEWIYKGLAILLIGCPCALVISTPAAIAAGLSNGARRGLLMKGGAVLEGLRKVTTVAFDKTGTLTEGKPQVTDVISIGRGERDVLALAAALEVGSSHPLAKAILARAASEGIEPKAAVKAGAINGKGVAGTVDGVELFLGSASAAGERATLAPEHNGVLARLNDEGKSVAILVADGSIAGILAMRDEPRADATAGIEALRRQDISAIMLTGDNSRTAKAVADAVGITARAELLPEDKLKIVADLKAKGEIVAKVGDGINDAPALAAADIGIAMGGGTDVALETADAAVLHGRVSDVAAMVDLSRRTMGNIGQNIAIALGLKAVFLVTTLLGVTGLWPAILADTGATVLVTMNALRLLGIRHGT
jgi:Cd2+/Zn2+-exporting ATPase